MTCMKSCADVNMWSRKINWAEKANSWTCNETNAAFCLMGLSPVPLSHAARNSLWHVAAFCKNMYAAFCKNSLCLCTVDFSTTLMRHAASFDTTHAALRLALSSAASRAPLSWERFRILLLSFGKHFKHFGQRTVRRCVSCWKFADICAPHAATFWPVVTLCTIALFLCLKNSKPAGTT